MARAIRGPIYWGQTLVRDWQCSLFLLRIELLGRKIVALSEQRKGFNPSVDPKTRIILERAAQRCKHGKVGRLLDEIAPVLERLMEIHDDPKKTAALLERVLGSFSD